MLDPELEANTDCDVINDIEATDFKVGILTQNGKYSKICHFGFFGLTDEQYPVLSLFTNVWGNSLLWLVF